MSKKNLIVMCAAFLAIAAVGIFVSEKKTTRAPIDHNNQNKQNDFRQSSFGPELNSAKYFGNEARGDLNGDGLEDVAFLVTENGVGSGIFYYVIVALQTPTGYKRTNPFFVGGRIAPQSTEIHSDSRELHVNFAERKDSEPMTTPPSVGAVLLLRVTPDGVLEGLMK